MNILPCKQATTNNQLIQALTLIPHKDDFHSDDVHHLEGEPILTQTFRDLGIPELFKNGFK